MAIPFKYYILNEQEIESGALDLRYYTRTQADGKYVLKETGKQLIESTILTDLTDGGNTTLHKHDDKADKIYATNLVTNGDFSNGTTGWASSGGVDAVVNKTLISTANGTLSYSIPTSSSLGIVKQNSKYYARTRVRVTNSVCQYIRFRLFASSALFDKQVNAPVENQWYELSDIFTSTNQTGNLYLYTMQMYADAATANGKVIEIDGNNGKGVHAIDLTSMFGVGKEPSKEQMDWIWSERERLGLGHLSGTAEFIPIVSLLNLVNTKANSIQEAWITPTLLNGATGTLQYRKNTMGEIVNKGTISVTAGLSIMQYPTGSRPLVDSKFILTSNTGFAPIYVIVFATGAMYVNSPNGTQTFDASAISFATQ